MLRIHQSVERAAARRRGLGLKFLICASAATLCPSANAAPAVKAEARMPVTEYDLAKLRDIGGTNPGLSISPSGRWLLFNLRQGDTARNAYQNQWILLDLKTKATRTLIEDAGPVVLSYGDNIYPWNDYNQGIQSFSPVWSVDEKQVAYVRKDSQGIRLHRVDVTTGSSASFAQLPQGKVVDLKADDGAALVTLEALTPNAGEIVDKWRTEGMQFTGNEFAPVLGIPKFDPPTERRTVRINVTTGEISAPALPGEDACAGFPGFPRDQDLSHMFNGCVFDPTGRAIATGRNLGAAGEGTALYTPAPGKPKKVTPSYDGISGPSPWNADRFYYVAHSGYSTSDIYEVGRNLRVRKITKSPFFLRGCEYNYAMAPFAVCLAETLTTPREIARVDLRSGRIEILTNINPEYNRLQHPRTVEVNWTSPSGDMLSGTITYPLNYDPSRRYPVVVTSYPHAGFTRGSNGDEFPIPVFASEGFLVLDVSAPAQHYWTAFEISYAQFARGYEAPLRALEQYLQKLSHEGIADISKVGVSGLSGGANFSAYAISHSDMFRAAIFDWHESDYLATITLARDRTRELYDQRGLGIDDKGNWEAYSLGFRPEHVEAAVLLNVADSEFFQAFGSYDALKLNGNAVEMWVYPDAHHVKWLPGQRLSVYERNVDWFNYWLQNEKDQAPEKAEQYARWKKLREKECARLKEIKAPPYCGQ